MTAVADRTTWIDDAPSPHARKAREALAEQLAGTAGVPLAEAVKLYLDASVRIARLPSGDIGHMQTCRALRDVGYVLRGLSGNGVYHRLSLECHATADKLAVVAAGKQGTPLHAVVAYLLQNPPTHEVTDD